MLCGIQVHVIFQQVFSDDHRIIVTILTQANRGSEVLVGSRTKLPACTCSEPQPISPQHQLQSPVLPTTHPFPGVRWPTELAQPSLAPSSPFFWPQACLCGILA